MCLFAGLGLRAQNDTAYIYTYGGASDDEGKDIIQTSDGGYLIVGSTSSFGNGSSDIYAVKIDSNFQTQWTAAYGGPQIESGEAVLSANDGGYYLIGYTNSFGSGGYDVYMVKIDSLGNKDWDDYYGGANWDFAYDAVSDSLSNIYIVGESYSFNGGDAQAYVLKLDEFGSIIWEKDFGGDKDDFARGVCQAYDGDLMLTGESWADSSDNSDLWFYKFDPSGAMIWQGLFGGENQDQGKSVVQLEDSGFVSIGFSEGDFGDKDVLIVKVDESGQFEWSRIHGKTDALDDIGYDIRETNQNYLVLAGSTQNYGSGGTDMYTIQTSGEGVWQTAPSYGGKLTDISYRTLRTKQNKDLFMGVSNSYTTKYLDIAIVIADTVDGNKSLDHTRFRDTSSTTVINSSVAQSENLSIQLVGNRILNPTKEGYSIIIYDIQGKIIDRTTIQAESELSIELERTGIFQIVLESNNDTQVWRFSNVITGE